MRAGHRNRDVRGHTRKELQIRIREFNNGVVGNHALYHRGVHAHLSDDSVKCVLWESVHFERDRLPHLNIAHVGLVCFRVYPHFLEVLRNRKNRRRLQRCGDCLTHIYVARHHRAINRRADHGVIKICLCNGHSGRFLRHLRFRLRDVRNSSVYRRVSGVKICFRQIELLLAHYPFFRECNGAGIVRFGLYRTSFRFFQIGFGRR